MKTIRKVVDSNVNSQSNYTQAVDILNVGEVVAFPTETVYGLGAVATDEVAVKKIFEAKEQVLEIIHSLFILERKKKLNFILKKFRKSQENAWIYFGQVH